MSANAPSQNSSNQLLAKLAVAACLLGKELHRLKLKRVDLGRADLRLGEKAYSSGTADGFAELVPRIDAVAQRITQLRQHEVAAASAFGGKAKVFTNRIAKAVQLGALRLKRRRLLRRLGANLRQGGASGSEEARSASAVANRITAAETAIAGLRPQTYSWARRPLVILTLLLLLIGLGGAFMLSKQHPPNLAQQKGTLSDAQMKKLLASQQTFQQQLLQMQAEAHRREAERMQARIAAAERAQREEIERRRAEQERVRREEAEREKVASAERARQEEKQREEESRIAAEKAKQEQEQQRREAEAQREKEQQEIVAREEQREKEKAVQSAKDEATRNQVVAQNSSSEPGSQPSAIASPEKSPESVTADMPPGLQGFEKLPHDPQLLDKLHAGRFEEIGQDKMDLVAVLKGFQDANFRLKDRSGIQVGPEQVEQMRRYFSDLLMAVEMMISRRGQPNYLKTIATIQATGGVDGEWAQTTYRNFMRLVLQRASGQFPETSKDNWLLKQRLVVSVSDEFIPKPLPQPTQQEAIVIEKQMQELATKNPQVIVAEYGDPGVKSGYHNVRLAFWYKDVPVLRRDLLAISTAHPLAELGNIALTEAPQTLGEANRKHADSLAAQDKKVEATPDIDNPSYARWKGFAPGASAVYIVSSWKQYGGKKQPQGESQEETAKLQSIDNEKAVVLIGGRTVTYPAKIRDTRLPEEKLPAADDVVELKGKKFNCKRSLNHWHNTYDVKVADTLWTSDEVPGGVVHDLEDEEDPKAGHYITDKTLQSYTGGKSGDWSGKPAGNPLFKTVFSFKYETGGRPKGPLIQGDDGNFYGITSQGPVTQETAGPGPRGTVFKLAPDGVLTTLHVFRNLEGVSPDGGLTKGRDGNFYGTTGDGGAPKKGAWHTRSFGTIFKITPSGQLTTLYYFGELPDGQNPIGELVQGRDGNFYGVTQKGGDEKGAYNRLGTIYKVTPSGSLTILHRFTEASNEGGQPVAGLVQGCDGNFYGTTSQGGLPSPGRSLAAGTVFKITPAGEFSTLYTFPQDPPGKSSMEVGDGEEPMCRLVEGADGELYGTTKRGGFPPGFGTIFKITPSTGAGTVLSRFTNRGGSNPESGLTRARDGNLYGTTGHGYSVFRFSPAGNRTTLYRFHREVVEQRNFGFGQKAIDEKAKWAEQELAAGRDHPELTDGSGLVAPLMEAADGKLWGTTVQGGIWDYGTVFRIDPKAAPPEEAQSDTERQPESSTGLARLRHAGELVRKAVPNYPQASREAIAELDRAIAENRTDVFALLYRAELKKTQQEVARTGASKQAQDYDGALADLDAVLKIEPHNILALRKRADIKRQKGDVAGAEADIDRASANTNAKEDVKVMLFYKAIGDQEGQTKQAEDRAQATWGEQRYQEALSELEKEYKVIIEAPM